MVLGVLEKNLDIDPCIDPGACKGAPSRHEKSIMIRRRRRRWSDGSAFRCPYEYWRACIQVHWQHLMRAVKLMRALPYFSPIARSYSRASASAWPCALAWAVLGGIVLLGHALKSFRHGWFEI